MIFKLHGSSFNFNDLITKRQDQSYKTQLVSLKTHFFMKTLKVAHVTGFWSYFHDWL